MTEPAAPAPTGLAAPAPVEPVWLVEATYAPDAAETRVPFRAEHIARLQELKRQGIVVERAADAEAALDVCRADVYLRNGVWVELRARAFGRVREG